MPRNHTDRGRGKSISGRPTDLPAKRAHDRRQLAVIAGIAVATAMGIFLRARAFQSFAQSWDACEYVWAIDGGYLPHSPYLIHHLLGRLLATVLPAGLALSVISFVAGTMSVSLLGAIVFRRTENPVAAIASSLLLAAAPVHMWYSGVQEVYVLQGALVLAALLVATSARRGSDLAAGIAFGVAFAAHNGTAFLIPAFALALLQGPRGGTRVRPAWRVGRGLAAALGTVGLAYGLVGVGFLVREGISGIAPFAEYVRGIAPLPREGVGWTPDRVLASWKSALRDGMGIPIVVWPLGLVLGGIALLRRIGDAALWVAWGIPFLVYELLLGTNLDRGLYAVYVAIPLAAVCGIGIGIVARAGGWGRDANASTSPAFALLLRGPAAVAALLLLVGPATLAAWRAGMQKPSRSEFFASTLIQTCLWIRDHTPPETIVVQPPGLINVNLVPCYARRRPILFQDGEHRLFVGARGAPLNLRSFRSLDRGVLEGLVREGTPVYSFVSDPFDARDTISAEAGRQFRWLPVEAAIAVGSVPRRITLWRLAPGTPDPAAGSPGSG
jgi:hypothetical protein